MNAALMLLLLLDSGDEGVIYTELLAGCVITCGAFQGNPAIRSAFAGHQSTGVLIDGHS